MADNLTLTPKEVITARINATNVAVGASLTPEMLTFGIPDISTGDGNTDLSVTAVPGSGYTGAETINYDRLHLTTDIANAYVASGAGRDLVFPVGNATTKAEMVVEVNARLGINLTPDDFIDGPLPEFQGEPNEEIDVQIVANADSLVYLGSITIKLKAEDIPLSDVIVIKRLTGLTYAPPA